MYGPESAGFLLVCVVDHHLHSAIWRMSLSQSSPTQGSRDVPVWVAQSAFKKRGPAGQRTESAPAEFSGGCENPCCPMLVSLLKLSAKWMSCPRTEASSYRTRNLFVIPAKGTLFFPGSWQAAGSSLNGWWSFELAGWCVIKGAFAGPCLEKVTLQASPQP